MMKLSHRGLAAAYATITVLAAFIYWMIWIRHPDYYVVQQEINLYPLRTIETLVQTNQIPPATASFEGLGDLSRKAADLINVAKKLRSEQEKVSAEIEVIEREIGAVISLMEKNRKKRIDEFIEKEMRPSWKERDALARKMDELEKSVSPEPVSYRKVGVEIAEMRVQLARLDRDVAIKKADLLTRIVRDFGQFAREEDVDRWRQVGKQMAGTREALRILEDKWRDHRNEAGITLGEWYSARKARLTLVDFLYFSLGVSTTTTFGDIIPNHSLVRTVVVVQLVAALMIVGLLVNSLWHQYGAMRK